jgi:hypothetical protein
VSRTPPDELTIVYIWSDRRRSFVAQEAGKVLCPECRERYGDGWYWGEVCPGEPFLTCPCGEQFSTMAE